MMHPTEGIIATSGFCVRLWGRYFSFLGPCVMFSLTLRILGYLALALSAFAVADGAEAGLVGSALSSFGHSSPVQTVQFGGSNCYYAEGWNGRGWYQCGSEWNYGFGWIGPVNLNTFGAFAIRRNHRHGPVVSHPRALDPIYPRLEPPRRLSVRRAEPSAGRTSRAPAFGGGGSPGWHRFGADGVPTSPNFRNGAATISPGFAGGGFHSRPGGGNFHQFHSAGIPHIGARVSPGFGGGAGLHGLGGATGVHIGAPASPSFAGIGTFHASGASFHGFGGAGGAHIGAPVSPAFGGGASLHGLGGATGVHIGAPASPSFAGIGTFHASGAGFPGFGGAGGVHIGAPASPGFASGGFHGFGGIGGFHGGGAAFGQGGIGHR
jgi:hypothetical protein